MLKKVKFELRGQVLVVSAISADAARDNLTIISAINQIKYFTHTETKLQKVW